MSFSRRSGVEGALVAALLLLGAYHLALTLSTVLSYGLVHPFADEFRLSYRYLAMPFPDCIFALENGHRPVIPGLLRWIGLVHLGGSQAVQSTASALCAILCVALVLREVHRGLPGRPLALACVACLLAVLIIWAGNARMLVHSNEAAHVFIVTLAVVAAALAAMRGMDTGHAMWWLVAVGWCLAATLTFGTGIASFGAVFAVAALQRARAALLGAIAAVAAATLAIYMYAMPGGDGVRNVVGTATFGAAVLFSLMRLGAVFAEFTDAKPLAGIVGGAIVGVFVASMAVRWVRRARFTRLQVFALALFAFAGGANLLIAASRAAYFFVYPEQVFADRYLYWSCMLWMSIGIFALASMPANRRLETAAGICVAALAMAMVPAAWRANEWARTTYEDVESVAAALRLGLHADDDVARISDGGAAVAYTLVSELRRRRMGDFTAQAAPAFREPVRVRAADAARVRFATSWPVKASPALAQRVSVHLPRALAHSIGSSIWVADRDARIVGAMAKAGQTRHPRNAARVGLPRFDVLVGYVAADAPRPLRLIERVSDGAYREFAEVQP